jgi:ubiquinone/menaquinone biosynthesis C-methylase UbiE
MEETDFYDEYYDRIYSIGRTFNDDELKRITTITNMIPSDVDSLLEVGCGEGKIINPLQNKYKKICGVDISDEALKDVKTSKIKGRIENLPLSSNSFDIVLCCEVLEHLPRHLYEKSLKEIQRVSRKYILISVPNNEDLEIEKIRCPQCGFFFHISGHLRSFNMSNIKNLFPDYELIKYDTVPVEVKKALKKDFFKFETHLCPKCGFFYPNEKSRSNTGNSKSILEKLPFKLPMKKSGGWIVALYKKHDCHEM